jgi:hypothetical protein
MNVISLSFGAASGPPTLLETVMPGLTVALIAGVVLFGLNWFREWLTARLKRSSEARVLAFSLVTEIDRLIAGCAEVVDDPLHVSENGISETTTKSPWIEFPDSWNWGSFPTKLQYRIRSIPNRIYLANRSVSSLYEYGDGPPDFYDAFEERTFRFAEIGVEAIEINDTLARAYGVPLLDRGSWDPREYFLGVIEKITARRDEEEARPRPASYWMLPDVPIEALKARYAKLTADLATAVERQKGN